jgi:hypothetical protein
VEGADRGAEGVENTDGRNYLVQKDVQKQVGQAAQEGKDQPGIGVERSGGSFRVGGCEKTRGVAEEGNRTSGEEESSPLVEERPLYRSQERGKETGETLVRVVDYLILIICYECDFVGEETGETLIGVVDYVDYLVLIICYECDFEVGTRRIAGGGIGIQPLVPRRQLEMVY